MFRIIATYLDYEIGPDVFDDGAVELKMHSRSFETKEKALAYIKNAEVRRIKKQMAYEGGVSTDIITAKYSFDGKQAYIDVSAELKPPLGHTYFGRYVYAVVKE